MNEEKISARGGPALGWKEEQLTSGLLSCPGCGAAVAMRMVLKILGPETIVVIPACCWTIISGQFPFFALKIPALHVNFETAGASASGIARGLKIKNKSHINVLAWAGDGGTFDIGIQSLSGAAERGENIIYVCYDNEAYMNTGIQRSSATPQGAWTTTTPILGEDRPKKDMMAIMIANDIPYCATISIAHPDDLRRKVEKAKSLNGQGLRYLHVLAPCPTGWRSEPSKTIELARLAVQIGIFPLYEFENIGGKKRLEVNCAGTTAVKKYLEVQGRFSHLSEDVIEKIQSEVNVKKEFLRKHDVKLNAKGIPEWATDAPSIIVPSAELKEVLKRGKKLGIVNFFFELNKDSLTAIFKESNSKLKKPLKHATITMPSKFEPFNFSFGEMLGNIITNIVGMANIEIAKNMPMWLVSDGTDYKLHYMVAPRIEDTSEQESAGENDGNGN